MKITALFLTLALFTFVSKAQLPPAFTSCPSTGFQVVNDPSEFQTVNLATGLTSTVNTFTGIQVNAMGFNPIDNRIYGIKSPVPRAVIIIGSDYSYQYLPLTGSPLPASFVGDVNKAGILWCIGGNGNFFTVNCNPAAGSEYGKVILKGAKPSVDAVDFSFPPEDSTRMYCVTSNGSLVYMKTTDLSAHNVMPANTVVAGQYGATYFDGNDNFYAKNNNSGVIYKFANATTLTPTVSKFSTSTASSQNDGARCASAPAPIIGDFGDAPESYGTSASSGGPVHLLPTPDNTIAKIYFGTGLSLDGDANPGAGANSDIDDGISSFPTIAGGINQPPLVSYTVTIKVHNTSAAVSNVSGWIDWNTNGVFDAGERATAIVPIGYIGTSSLTWNAITLSGATGRAGTYARFRISTSNLSSAGGTVPDGEVEDYFISFLAVLPASIISFAAVKSHSQVHLNWVTATEQNNRGFTIERSADGILFVPLDFLQSQAKNGSSDRKLSYVYYDKNPAYGNIYYRLKQTDFDGKTRYSITAKVINSNFGNAIILYPNPAKEEITIVGLKGNEKIFLYGQKGELLKTNKANSKMMTIKINDISDGIYHFKITDAAGNSSTHKIVKQQ